jgi:hypothetical protein
MILGIALSFVLVSAMQWILGHRVNWLQSWTFVNEIAVIKLGMSTFVLAIIVLLSGADHFFNAAQIPNSMPSLAMVFPQLTGRIHGVLAIIDPFNAWTVALYFVVFRKVWITGRAAALLAA